MDIHDSAKVLGNAGQAGSLIGAGTQDAGATPSVSFVAPSPPALEARLPWALPSSEATDGIRSVSSALASCQD